MDFLTLAKTRFSVRKYKTKKVEEEKLLKIIEAGRLAPSAANFQPWHFIIVNHPRTLEKIHASYKREWIKSAPVILVACADHRQSWKRSSDGKDSADIDLAIAIDHMTLMAADLRLGSCWICNFDVNRCIESLDLPDQIEPLALLPIGYPDEQAGKKKRKPANEIIHFNSFGNQLK